MSTATSILRLGTETVSKWYGNLGRGKKWLFLGVAASLLFSVSRRLYYRYYNYKHKLPPQRLYHVPIFGSIFAILFQTKHYLLHDFPQYGDLVCVNFLDQKRFYINDAVLARKAFEKLMYRSAIPRMRKNKHFEIWCRLLTTENNPHMIVLRRKQMLNSISNVFNSSSIEKSLPRVLESITFEYLDNNVIKNNNGIWYPRECLHNVSLNTILYASFGKIYTMNDTQFQQFCESTKMMFKYVLGALAGAVLPYYLGGFMFGNQLKMFYASMKFQQDFISQEMKKIENKMQLKSRSALDLNGDGEEFSKYSTIAESWLAGQDDIMTRQVICAQLQTMVIGATDTTSHTMEVGVLLLAKHKNVQESIYNELVNVYGAPSDGTSDSDSGRFSFGKLNKCPVLRAFTSETLRIACPISRGVPRTDLHKDLRIVKYTNMNKNSKFDFICDFVDSDVWKQIDNISNTSKDGFEYNGENIKIEYDYVIPKTYTVLPNLAYMLHGDKKIWNKDGNAMILNLNYWLNKNGTYKNNINSIPFGVGKRACTGQLLARNETIACLANIILKYKIEPVNNESIEINFDYKPALVVKPQVAVKVSKRQC